MLLMNGPKDNRVSIIVPTLNEGPAIATTLDQLSLYRDKGHEVILADGDSVDDTVVTALPYVDRVVSSEKGRGRQMNNGAMAATGDILLFLHADTRLPAGAIDTILCVMKSHERCWGRFDVQLSGTSAAYRVIETLMNWRSGLSGIATGDQAIFVRNTDFKSAGGFPEIELMEDIVLSRRLGRKTPPVCLKQRVITSSRRWEQDGVIRTVLKMWLLRLAFLIGVRPSTLARYYG